jgi:ribosomal protein S17
MYHFQTSEGHDVAIRFHHKRSGKDSPPKSTLCKLVQHTGDVANGSVIGEGIAKCIRNITVIANADKIGYLYERYGKSIKRVHKTIDKSQAAVVMSGDNFSFTRARKISLRKALDASNLDKQSRKNAWAAMLGDVVK